MKDCELIKSGHTFGLLAEEFEVKNKKRLPRIVVKFDFFFTLQSKVSSAPPALEEKENY